MKSMFWVSLYLHHCLSPSSLPVHRDKYSCLILHCHYIVTSHVLAVYSVIHSTSGGGGGGGDGCARARAVQFVVVGAWCLHCMVIRGKILSKEHAEHKDHDLTVDHAAACAGARRGSAGKPTTTYCHEFTFGTQERGL